MKSKHISKEKEDSQFAMLLEQAEQQKEGLQPGQAVKVTITDINDREFIFLSSDYGEGVLPRDQLTDQDGKITVNPGEKIDAFFEAVKDGENRFTLVPTGKVAKAILISSLENEKPLKAKVLKKIKGGFELLIGDQVAFCPGSQMDGDPANGETTEVIVLETGHNKLVVSNRKYKDILKERQKELLQDQLEEGSVLTGTVTRLMDFGAFVDVGGLEGLIPVSELSYKRVKNAAEVLKSGEEVRVKVLAIDWKEDKLTLSLKALLQNPWQGTLPFKEGDIVEGEIESLKTFGLFVKLTGGFTGLVPVSQTGTPRGTPIDKDFSKGQSVRVMIMTIDRDNQKISLSVEKVKEADTRKEYEAYMKDSQDTSGQEEISSFGKLLQASLNKQKK